MGLEGVEIIFAAEETFGIEISNADSADLRTPRMLADYIFARIAHRSVDSATSAHCASQAAFYLIRKTLVEQFGIARQGIRPDTLLNTLLTSDLLQQWSQLKAELQAHKLPPLECSKHQAFVLRFLIPSSIFVALLFRHVSFIIALGSQYAAHYAGSMICKKTGKNLPESIPTIAALVPYIPLKPSTQWTAETVLRQVILITAEVLNIPADNIQPDHLFIEDLGTG